MISVVVPVKDEVATLPDLVSRTLEAGTRCGQSLEIILVDDGSADGSWQEIQKLAASHTEVSGLRLRRNFGKAAALMAGFHGARGDLILTLDADLQDDPAEFPPCWPIWGGEGPKASPWTWSAAGRKSGMTHGTRSSPAGFSTG